MMIWSTTRASSRLYYRRHRHIIYHAKHSETERERSISTPLSVCFSGIYLYLSHRPFHHKRLRPQFMLNILGTKLKYNSPTNIPTTTTTTAEKTCRQVDCVRWVAFCGEGRDRNAGIRPEGVVKTHETQVRMVKCIIRSGWVTWPVVARDFMGGLDMASVLPSRKRVGMGELWDRFFFFVAQINIEWSEVRTANGAGDSAVVSCFWWILFNKWWMEGRTTTKMYGLQDMEVPTLIRWQCYWVAVG